MFVACGFGTLAPLSPDCDLFVRTFSSQGVAYSFNVRPFWDVFKRTEKNTQFYDEIVRIKKPKDSPKPAHEAPFPYNVEFG